MLRIIFLVFPLSLMAFSLKVQNNLEENFNLSEVSLGIGVESDILPGETQTFKIDSLGAAFYHENAFIIALIPKVKTYKNSYVSCYDGYKLKLNGQEPRYGVHGIVLPEYSTLDINPCD